MKITLQWTSQDLQFHIRHELIKAVVTVPILAIRSGEITPGHETVDIHQQPYAYKNSPIHDLLRVVAEVQEISRDLVGACRHHTTPESAAQPWALVI